MDTENLSDLSIDELAGKIKKSKSLKMMGIVLIGFCIGIFAYSAVNNGWEFFTFFPLIIAFFMYRGSVKNKEVLDQLEHELAQRNTQ